MTDLSRLAAYSMALKESQIQCLLEILLEAGAFQVTGAGQDDTWLIWNNGRDERAKFVYAQEDLRFWEREERFVQESGVIPRFRVFSLDENKRLTVTIGNYSFSCA